MNSIFLFSFSVTFVFQLFIFIMFFFFKKLSECGLCNYLSSADNTILSFPINKTNSTFGSLVIVSALKCNRALLYKFRYLPTLVKVYFKRSENVSATLSEYRKFKGFRKSIMKKAGFWKILLDLEKFEFLECYFVQIIPQNEHDTIATDMHVTRVGTSILSSISRTVDFSHVTVWKLCINCLNFAFIKQLAFKYFLSERQKVLRCRSDFPILFLSRCTVRLKKIIKIQYKKRSWIEHECISFIFTTTEQK